MENRLRRFLLGVGPVFVLLGCADAQRPTGSGSASKDAPEARGSAGQTAADSADLDLASTTGSGGPTSVAQEIDPNHLVGPDLSTWTATFPTPSHKTDELDMVIVAADLNVKLYSRPGARYAIGYARYGGILAAKETDSSCSGGKWYQVNGNAFVCSGKEAIKVLPWPVTADVLPAEMRGKQPRLDEANPYDYGKAKDGAPLLSRLPDKDELAELEAGHNPGGLVERYMKGAFLLALARKVEVHGEEFYETVESRFVRVKDVDDKPTPPLNSGHLDSPDDLPLAFAADATELLCNAPDEAEACGVVDKHARFAVTGPTDDGKLVLLRDDRAIARKAVRLIERIDRPRGVDEDDKWIHVNLTEQTLTAYEGDDPVYVTLVASGKPSHATPTGLYQIEKKYASKTMRGQDEDGPYVVEQVPWTMFYKGAFALHGAYWHNVFGNTRSHGCINVPPADARWIYHWSDPDLIAGWHAMFHKRGTHVYITGSTPSDEDS